MTPEAKLSAVRNARGNGPVVMVGDGVNDAAALAAADVGIAVHGGAEASLAAADVYIASPGMTPLVDLIQSSRKTMRIIRRNLLLSLVYNVLTGGFAAAGKMNPLVAAILMPAQFRHRAGDRDRLRAANFGGPPMTVLFIVLPLAILMAAIFLTAFILCVRRGQYDDLDTPPLRMLFDDEPSDSGKGSTNDE